MSLTAEDCCVLNAGSGAWAFEPLAIALASALEIEIATEPRRFNYVIQVDEIDAPNVCDSFIPIDAIRTASDKRLLARLFLQHNVPTPTTRLFETFAEVQQFIRMNSHTEWCLKYPTSCGGNGHRMIAAVDSAPANWPVPYVVQEFVRMKRPEVYRTYCAGGEIFGWVARRYPDGSHPSPWVAHARGARYVRLDSPPDKAMDTARQALVASNLHTSFGCVDLICKPAGEWVALEVGTDGLFNHVDRNLDDATFEQEISKRIAAAFWKTAALKSSAHTSAAPIPA